MRKMHERARRLTLLTTLLTLFAAGASLGAAQDEAAGEPAAEADPWGPLKLLEGSWSGEIDGKLGTGKGVRRYELIQRDQYLLRRHISIRLPQEKSPEGDQHEELGIYSYDRERQKIVLREFLIEGLVARSNCEVEAMTVVCASEAVESGPGIRTRMTLEFENPYRFAERYEIGFPGRDLELYFTNRWTRAPTPSGWN